MGITQRILIWLFDGSAKLTCFTSAMLGVIGLLSLCKQIPDIPDRSASTWVLFFMVVFSLFVPLVQILVDEYKQKSPDN